MIIFASDQHNKKMQNKKSRGFFDEEMRLDKLTKQKAPLVKLQSQIDSIKYTF